MLRDLATDDRAFIGRDAIRARAGRQDVALEADAASSSTGATTTGSTTRPGLIPPKDHTPIQDEYYVYDDDLSQLGYATS